MKFFKTLLLVFASAGVFRAQITVTALVDHLVPDGIDTIGNINLMVSGSTAPYTYTWNAGAYTTKDIASVKAGQYTLNVTSASSQTLTRTYSVGYKTQWDKLYGTVLKHDTLATTSAYNWGTAVSKNTLAGGTDGWFEYILTGLDKIKTIGFLDSISPIAGHYYDVDYGFYCYNNTLYTIVNGVVAGSNNGINGVTAGTVLRVERSGPVINLKVNGVIISSTTNTLAAQKDWKIKGALLSPANTNLINVGCSFNQTGSSLFANYNCIIPYVEHSSRVNIADGSIKVSPASSGTYTYTWEQGDIVSSAITAKPIGSYKVTMQDDINHRSSSYINIGYKTQWDKFYGTVLKHDTLATTSAYNWGTAVSKNTLAGGTDGWFEYILTGLDKIKTIGFLDSISPIAGHYYDVDYGFYCYNNTLYTIVNGVVAGSNNGINGVTAGTVLRVERIGFVIILKVNGVIISSTTNTLAAQKDWKIKGALLSGTNTNLINVGCSFYQTGSTLFANYNRLIPYVEHSSGVNIADGSIKVSPASSGTYTYNWELGNIVSSAITAKPIGSYKVTMQDDINHRSSSYINIGYKTQWDKLYGAVLKHDTLATTSAYSWGTAVSKNTLAAGSDGWVEYIVTDPSKYNMIGFLDSISPIAGTYTDIDYGFYCATNSLYPIINGVYANQSIISGLTVGAVLRVERIGPVINLKVNGAIVSTITNSLATQKDWKIKGVLHSWANTNLINVGCSFYQTGSTLFANYNRLIPYVEHSSGVNIADGSIKVSPASSGTYTYNWELGNIVSSAITAKPIGSYTQPSESFKIRAQYSL